LEVLQRPAVVMDPKERWLAHFEGEESKNRHRRALERFETIVGVKATDLLERARKCIPEGKPPEELEDALTNYHSHLIAQGQAPTSAAQWYSLIRGFFSANHIRLGRTPREITASGAAYESSRVLTQKQVRRMIASRRKLRDKLVITFLAQTGQRLGVITAMKYGMIRKVDGRGLVEVPPTLLNPHGENVNKAEVRYKFVIGRNAMRLIEKVADKKGWVLDLSERQIGRIVDQAASNVGIQEPIETKLKRSWHFVHPHVFRKYWKHQMKLGGVKDPDLLNSMMGHKLAYAGAYDVFLDEDLLKAYKRAERKLQVL